jgi:DNA polymerase-1
MSTAKKQRTLLIDGDTIAYIAASAVQDIREDSQGFVQPFANVHIGRATVDNLIIGLMRDLEAHGMQVYLSDPAGNWRSEIKKDYKSNRIESFKGQIRPLLLGRMKEYLRESYEATHWAGLEADDVMGIQSTTKHDWPGDTVIVGRDKDFKTFPGLHHQIGMDKRGVIREITLEEADFFHLVQAFAGDRVDGYEGCPGIGMDRAKKILAEPVILEPEYGKVTRGLRKGQATVKWMPKPAHGNLWACIVSHYLKAGLGEEDALRNARMARILRANEYDRETGKVILWTPPKVWR